MDEIRIDDLEVYAYHGVFPEENEKGQPFYVKAVLYTDTRAAGCQDELTLSTHYGEVCHLINNWMKEHTCKLIETVAEGTAREILLHFPLIKELDLEIRKPQAPVGLPFQSVSVRIHRGWHKAYIALGSNMGSRERIISQAVHSLKENADVRVGKVSQLINTAPYGGVEQDEFLNGVMEIDTLYTPGELLEELHRLETDAGRERLVHWGPRTLDLDIIFYDKVICEEEALTIPHRDMQNRDFVLKPLAELAPGFRHPVLGKSIAQLLEELEKKSL